jgi:hypothetical protein
MSGKSYAQRKKVTFETEVASIQLEYCHNVIAQTQPDPSQNKEYNSSDAMLMARLVDDHNRRSIICSTLFTQQRDQGFWIEGARRVEQRNESITPSKTVSLLSVAR